VDERKTKGEENSVRLSRPAEEFDQGDKQWPSFVNESHQLIGDPGTVLHLISLENNNSFKIYENKENLLYRQEGEGERGG